MLDDDTSEFISKYPLYSQWYFISHGKLREKLQVQIAAKNQLSKYFNIWTDNNMAKKRGLSADEKRQKMLQSMLEGVNLAGIS